MSDLFETVRESEPITEPPKRWRNRWRALQAHATVDRSGAVIALAKGELRCGDTVWPSRDAAESYAAKAIAHNAVTAPGCLEYVGAVLEGDSPRPDKTDRMENE